MRIFVFVALGWCALVSGCGDKADPIDPFGETPGYGGSGSHANPTKDACVTYCNFIVANGAECATYNDQGRCTSNCVNYASGPCPTEWSAFQSCVEKSSKITCFTPPGSKPVLETVGCSTPYDAWINCQKANDAGCPQSGP